MNTIEMFNRLPLYQLQSKINNNSTIADIQTDKTSLQKYSRAYTSIGIANISFQGKITPDTIKVIRREYASGKSLEQVALVLNGLGLTISTVYIFKLINMQNDAEEIKKQHKENHQTKKNVLTEENSAAILKDYENGMKLKDIAKKYGCCKMTIIRAVKNHPEAGTLKNIHIKNSQSLTLKNTQNDIQRIKELYLKGFSSYQIAKEMGCDATTIRYHLNRLDNFEQIQKIHANNNKSSRFILSDKLKQKIVKEYKNGKTADKIAEEFGTTGNTIMTYIKSLDNFDEIEQVHIKNKQGNAIITEDKLNRIIELYENGEVGENIAKQVGCTESTVYRKLSEHENADEIMTKHYKNAKQKTSIEMSVITADMIDKMIYLYSAGYTYKDIGKKLNCSTTTVAKYIKANDDYDRIIKKHIRNNKSKCAIMTEDKILLLESMYRAGKTIKDIAVILKCSDMTISKYLREMPDFDELYEEHLKNYNGPLGILSNEDVLKVIELYKEGKSAQKIAPLFGCSYCTILKKINEQSDSENIKEIHNANWLKNKEK